MEKLSIEEIRKLAERIATDKLAPRASEIDRTRSFPWENILIEGNVGSKAF